MISKYMKVILDKLLGADFRFFSFEEGGEEEFDMKKLDKDLQRYFKLIDKGGEAADKACLTTIVRSNYYKPDRDIVGTDLYHCPDSENLMHAKLFETKKVYDAYGSHDIEIDGKTVRFLNNYGDEDGTGDRVGDNYAWFSPCIMYAEHGKLVFELADLIVAKEAFGEHKPRCL